MVALGTKPSGKWQLWSKDMERLYGLHRDAKGAIAIQPYEGAVLGVNASLRIVRGLSEARGNGRICKSKRPYCRKRPTSIRLGMDACLKA